MSNDSESNVVNFQRTDDVSWTPRELLLRVLNDVDDLREVIVIARTQDGRVASGSSALDEFTAVGLLEYFKHKIIKSHEEEVTA